MVVPVLMTSCHVSDQPKIGPDTAHRRTTAIASTKVEERPTWRSTQRANCAKSGASWRLGLEVSLVCGRGIDRLWIDLRISNTETEGRFHFSAKIPRGPLCRAQSAKDVGYRLASAWSPKRSFPGLSGCSSRTLAPGRRSSQLARCLTRRPWLSWDSARPPASGNRRRTPAVYVHNHGRIATNDQESTGRCGRHRLHPGGCFRADVPARSANLASRSAPLLATPEHLTVR